MCWSRPRPAADPRLGRLGLPRHRLHRRLQVGNHCIGGAGSVDPVVAGGRLNRPGVAAAVAAADAPGRGTGQWYGRAGHSKVGSCGRWGRCRQRRQNKRQQSRRRERRRQRRWGLRRRRRWERKGRWKRKGRWNICPFKSPFAVVLERGPAAVPPSCPPHGAIAVAVSSTSTPTAPPAPSPPKHGQQLSDKEAAAAAAAATAVVRQVSGEQAASAAAQRPGDFSHEVGSAISSAGRPPYGGYTAAYAMGFSPPPPMPMSLLSPQTSVTGLGFASNESIGR